MNNWFPTASHKILRKRADILLKIRRFFYERNILEVDTPLLTQYTTTDVNISTFQIHNQYHCNKNMNLWLIPSPEYHMKRLLSSGIGAIYQICHVFRKDEIGKYHNPEFTMLEWYQPFYSIFDMMHAIDIFLFNIFGIETSDKFSYQEIFIKYFSIDPFNTNIGELNKILKNLNQKQLIRFENTIFDVLDLIFMISIEPILGKKKPIFIYYYPANQAMLATINKNNPLFANRFEFFFKGVEIGNGFHELIDSIEQERRFKQDNLKRKKLGLPIRIIDYRLLECLSYMTKCSGVAIGLDRLFMIYYNIKNINEILSFSFKNC